LFWYWSLVVTHIVFKRMFMMAGQEKRMMRQGVAEAAANLAMSIALTWWLRSIVGVALGSVIPTFLFGWGLLWPWAAKEAGLTKRALFHCVVLRTLLGCLPMLGTALAFRWQPWWLSGGNSLLVFLEGGIVMAVGAAGLWKLTLSPEERESLVAKLGQKLGRKAKSS
jgi:hypothetical protein